MSEPINVLTTRLVLNLDLMQKFGPHGAQNNPIDASPFCFMVLSDYTYSWMNSRDIIQLRPDTQLKWEMEVMGEGQKLTVSGIKIVFRFIGLKKEELHRAINMWKDIFILSENDVIDTEGNLVLHAGDLTIGMDKKRTLSAEITTCDSQTMKKVANNLTYSISFTFTELGKNYFCRIDPLIKNNSNDPGFP